MLNKVKIALITTIVAWCLSGCNDAPPTAVINGEGEENIITEQIIN